jgi:putative peptidoglycan lipid II flippase
MVMARFFGAGQAYDAFLLGFRIPNLARDLFAEGALSSAFVPAFTRTMQTEGRRAAAELSNLVATALILIVGVLCVLGMIFSSALVQLLAPGFTAIPGKFELSVTLTRIMFPFLLLVALAAQAMGVLNACDRFGVPALASTFFNVGSVVFGLVLGFWLGPRLGLDPITGMAYGVVIGGGLQLFSQVPSLVRAGFVLRPRLNWSHPGLRQILRMMGPAILGNAAVQVNVMVNTNFASGITDAAGQVINGPVSWLSYAFRFMQLPLGLFGVAIAAATLPAISRSAAASDLNAFRATLSRSLGMVLLLTLPASAGLAVLGEPMIGAIYQRGAFTGLATEQTARALSFYAIGLAGYAALKVLAPAFYALGDARTPMLISLASIAVNYGVAFTMVRHLGIGHVGLALSTSAVAWFGCLAQLLIMRARLGGIRGRALAFTTLKAGLASLVMGLAVAAASRAMLVRLGDSNPARLADLAISIPLGIGLFYALCRWLRVEELEAVMRALPWPFSRRSRPAC